MFAAAIVLSLLVIIFAAYSFLLKRDIQELDETLSQIRNADTNLKLTTQTFDKDISRLSLSINDLLEKNQEISRKSEHTNLELRRAITNISHDLRTPLTSIMGYMQMLKSGKTPENKKAEYLDIVESRLKSLSALIDELFEFTQIVEGHTSYHIERVNICNPLMDVISAFYDDFTDKGIVPEISIPNAPVYAYCDVNALKRIAQNLIKNAFQHGNKSFNLTVCEGAPELVFANNAPDVRSLDVNRLFERFYTTDAPRTNKNAGLGLAIAKELTEQMGGEITAKVNGDFLVIRVRLPEC